MTLRGVTRALSSGVHPACRCAGFAAVLAAQLYVAAALGAPVSTANVEGYVLSVEGGDVIIDIGANRGASVGDVVELWRPIELVHPVTKQRIRDRYRIGVLKLVQVRDRMAVAVAEGAKLEPVTGDFVVWRRKAPEPAPVAPPAPGAGSSRAADGGAPGAPIEDEARKVSALFESLREASLVDRIRAYVAYVKKNPSSPFAPVLREDAVQYHRLLQAQGTAAQDGSVSTPSTQVVASSPKPALAVDFDPPAHAVGGRGLELGLHASSPVVGAVLHVRGRGDVGYRSVAMARAGSGYFRATIPADAVRPPTTEYFIEGVDAEGRAVPVAGTDDQPFTVEVERRPDAEPPMLQRRTTVTLLTDWADFNRLRSDRMDRTWQTEGALGMRFGDVGVRAVRSGFGVYRGVSGSREALDDLSIAHPFERDVGLTYGYLEGEFGFLHSASLIARVVTGLTDSGIASGGLGMVRIGNDLETNLSLGVEILGAVGVRSITELDMYPLPRFSVLLRSEVTNQPAGTSDPNAKGAPEFRGDLGLRGIVQPGYEFFPGFVLAARFSYQGRTIYHAGPGFGGAVSYSW